MTICRCHQPKRQRVGDDGKGMRLLFCEEHGFVLRRVPKYAQPEGLFLRIPTKGPRGKT
jgi:hypothetical protein